MIAPLLSSTHFSWKGTSGVAFASSLEHLGYNLLSGDPFKVTSQKTGVTETFYRDLLSERSQDEKKFSTLDRSITITIFNT